MRQQTCKPFARQNKNKQNGFGICYHFAIKQEMRFSKSEYFQGFSASHIHFFLIPTRQIQVYEEVFLLNLQVKYSQIC
jgi:hypothetical protein